MRLSGVSIEIDIDCVSGTCYHFEEMDIYWIGASKLSHILCPGAGPSVIQINDVRFIY
jgi:hypothetical protein